MSIKILEAGAGVCMWLSSLVYAGLPCLSSVKCQPCAGANSHSDSQIIIRKLVQCVMAREEIKI